MDGILDWFELGESERQVYEFFTRRADRRFPNALYQIVADCFAITQCWEPLPSAGPERGRHFERVFCQYCDNTGAPLSERPGSRTLNGTRSSSGFNHESDAVIAWPDFIVHVELKYLSTELSKNELLIFNQKGFDFLAAANASVRRRPLYRLLVSGRLISEEARRFALLWGIVVVEPERLPLLLVHGLAGCVIPRFPAWAAALQDEIWDEVARIIAPAQKRLERFVSLLSGGEPLVSDSRISRLLEVYQLHFGDAVWAALDDVQPHWLEERYEKLKVDMQN